MRQKMKIKDIMNFEEDNIKEYLKCHFLRIEVEV